MPSESQSQLAPSLDCARPADTMIRFWDSLDRTQYPFIAPERLKEFREPRKPPPQFREKHIEAPEKYLSRSQTLRVALADSRTEKRFRRAKSDLAKRNYETFVKRQQWLIDNGLRTVIHDFPKVPKRYSDYYQLNIKAKRAKKAEKDRQAKLASSATAEAPRDERPGPFEAGPSRAPALSVTPAQSAADNAYTPMPPPSSTPQPASLPAGDDPMVGTSPRRTVARPPPSVAASLDSLFDEMPTRAPTSALPTPSNLASTPDPPQPVAKKRKILESPESQPEPKAPRTEAGPSRSLALSSTRLASKGKSMHGALASIGKIAKKKDDPAPPPDPKSQPSFGDPQPGIFEQIPQPPPPVAAPSLAVDTSAATPDSAAKQPPSTAAKPPAPASASTSKLFIDPEETTPQVSPTRSKPVEVKPESMSATAGPSAPPVPKIPLSDRPKYQQPVKMKKIDDVPTVSRKLPPKPWPAPGGFGGASPVDPSVRPSWKSPVYPYTGQSPDVGGRTPTGPGFAPPTQPRTAAFVSRGSGPGPSQTIQLAQPPASAAPFVRPPQALPGGLPTRPPPSGPGGLRPPRPIPTGPANGAPQRPSNLPSPPHPARPAQRPPQEPSGQPPSAYNAAADPRRKGSTYTSPVLPNLTSPLGPVDRGGKTPTHPTNEARPRLPSRQSHAEFSVPLEITANLPLRDESDVTSLDMRLIPGAALATKEPSVAQLLLRNESGKAGITFEEVEPIAVKGNISLGAKVVQWVRAALLTKHDTGYAESWTLLKDMVKSNKVSWLTEVDRHKLTPLQAYVSYGELEATNPKHHYAILIASPALVDISRLGLGSWKMEDISVGIFILQLPLTSMPPPQLSNPVRPSMPLELDIKPELPDFSQPADVLESYGVSSDFLNQYRGRRVIKYPVPDHKLDILDKQLTDALKKNEINGVAPKSPPDFVILLNQRFRASMRPSAVRNVVLHRTPIYACGPSLSLYPSQYGLQPIWQHGALVTFSPSFILHSPDRFTSAMRLIRLSHNWAAYITPAVIEWCQASWAIPA